MAHQSQDLFLRLVGKHGSHLGQDLGITEVQLGDGIVGTFGHASSAAMAHGSDDLRGFVRLNHDGVVGTLVCTDGALLGGVDTTIGPDMSNDRLDWPSISGHYPASAAGRRTALGDARWNIFWSLSCAG